MNQPSKKDFAVSLASSRRHVWIPVYIIVFSLYGDASHSRTAHILQPFFSKASQFLKGIVSGVLE